MNRNEIIKAWKNNTRTIFADMPEEMQEFAMMPICYNFKYLSGIGNNIEWKIKDTPLFFAAGIYRLKEDYNPPFTSFELDVHSYYINDKDFGRTRIHMAGNNYTIAEVEQHIKNLQRLVKTAKGIFE